MENFKKHRRLLRAQVTKLLGKDELINIPSDIIKLEVLREQLQEKKAELKNLDQQIIELSTEKDEEILKDCDVSEEYQEKIIEALKKIELCLREEQMKKGKSAEKVEITNTKEGEKERKTISARLPKIELPIFEGDINNWNSFWQVFDATINQRQDLSTIEKLTYLISLLKGEPSRLVAGFAVTAENYEDIIKTLQNQYDHKERIVDLNVKRILEMKPVTSLAQVKELKHLITELSINLRNLKNNGINVQNCSPIIITKIKQLIPAELLLIYERQKDKNKEASTEDLLTFLNTEINYRENVAPSLDPRAPTFKPRNYPQYKAAPGRNWQPRAQAQPPRVGAYQSSNAGQNYSGEAKQMARIPRLLTTGKYNVICFKCGQGGHVAKHCPSNN